jgi:peptidoglycan hydrolase-like protein with peptidoglycan-binding domain
MAADVQMELSRRGFYYGNIDGIIGPQSRNAIRRYQVRYGLPVTGAIDYPLTRSLALR